MGHADGGVLFLKPAQQGRPDAAAWGVAGGVLDRQARGKLLAGGIDGREPPGIARGLQAGDARVRVAGGLDIGSGTCRAAASGVCERCRPAGLAGSMTSAGG
jgi:hypothetical protein